MIPTKNSALILPKPAANTLLKILPHYCFPCHLPAAELDLIWIFTFKQGQGSLSCNQK